MKKRFRRVLRALLRLHYRFDTWLSGEWPLMCYFCRRWIRAKHAKTLQETTGSVREVCPTCFARFTQPFTHRG